MPYPVLGNNGVKMLWRWEKRRLSSPTPENALRDFTTLARVSGCTCCRVARCSLHPMPAWFDLLLPLLLQPQPQRTLLIFNLTLSKVFSVAGALFSVERARAAIETCC